MEMRECKECKRVLEFCNDNFSKNGVSETGKQWYHHKCKSCSNKNQNIIDAKPENKLKKKEWRNKPENKLRENISNKKSRKEKKLENPKLQKAKDMINTRRNAAAKESLFFNITEKDILEKFRDYCNCCKKTFVMDSTKKCSLSPNLHKIYPKLGYVKGKIDVICTVCNNKISNSTPEEAIENLPLVLEYCRNQIRERSLMVIRN